MTVRRRFGATSSSTMLCILAHAVFFILAMLLALAPAASQTEVEVLDNFENLSAWDALTSDGVFASISGADTPKGRGLKLEFDFQGVAGFASAARHLPLDLPENYEISFLMRADAPVNTLEFKLADASGDNVWWHRKQNFEFPTEWKRIRIKKRQISFAWGPTQDHALRHSEKIEFAITAGKGGGSGAVYIDELVIREIPPPPLEWPQPIAEASSSAQGHDAQALFDGKPDTGWRSVPAAGKQQRITLDFSAEREFGGLTLHWAEHAHASSYDVSTSIDGGQWELLRRVRDGDGGADPLMLHEGEARYLRIDLHDGPGAAYALNGLDVEALAFGATPNAFVTELARDARRGLYPRGFRHEQTYWTLVGVNGGRDSGLMSEDGAIELRKGGVSVEPFVLTQDRLVTWADVEVHQSLHARGLPIPSVHWAHPAFELRVTAIAAGAPEEARLHGRYDITNRSGEAQRLTLALAIRPLQVNPPQQQLNIAGGISPIEALKWDGRTVSINGAPRLTPLSAPSEVALAKFDSARFPESLANGRPAVRHEVHDPTDMASGVLLYELELAPNETKTIGWAAPLTKPSHPIAIDEAPEETLDAALDAAVEQWRAALSEVRIDTPPEGDRIVNSIRMALAHILMSRDGPALKPGTRAYDRSWIRDGAMISESLVRLGHAGLAEEYLRWYAPHQFENGKIPCCIDGRGPDPIPENDSQGELIFLAAEIWRYTKDKALLDDVWPRVLAAARYMDHLRRSTRIPENQTPERRMLYGLMPPSISHEGYAAKPAYSYWDNFWSLRGYKDAAAIAEILSKPEVDELRASRDEFAHDLLASIKATADVHEIGYIAGAADLGDFDATSTTIALAPGGEMENLPQDLLHNTFERYWRHFVERRDSGKSWDVYTPYELRNVGAFLRLGWRERAHELLAFFFADQRPAGWLQWAEVVGREPRVPRFIGDMPHAWVASDYIRSALDLFVHRREKDEALILAAGVPVQWLQTEGVSVTGLSTPYGEISYSARPEGDTLMLSVSGDAPPGGFVFPLPWPRDQVRVASTGAPVSIFDGEIRLHGPGDIAIERKDLQQPASLRRAGADGG